MVGSVAGAGGVYEEVLGNGLKIIVREDNRSPVVVSQIWYKVGSSYEYGGITGISHILEHMMFQGTDDYPAGEFSRIIAANGGDENAFTGRDYTAYFQTMEKSRLAISFALEADRMHNLNPTAEQLDKELQVVTEERRMRTEDRPRAKLYEHFMAAAFANSPYHHPIIGWPADIASCKVADIVAWYQKWYAPNNATIVVVGDVVAADVFALASEYFGDITPSQLPATKPQTEIPQYGTRKITLKLPAKLPYIMMGYKVPVLSSNEDDAYALEVLAGILDGGNSSRLQSQLVRGAQIAVSAGASYNMYARLPTLLSLSAIPAKNHDIATVELALSEQVLKLQTELVSPAELQKVKSQVAASAVYQRDSNFYQGMQLGILETIGESWQRAGEYVGKIEQVSAEQVRQVATKYLLTDRLTIAYLQPQAINPTSPNNE